MRRLLASLLLLTGPVAAVTAEPPPVKVFILAGQSNMEGKAKVALLEHQARQEATRALFAHWRDGDGWATREDVRVKFLDRRGPLTVGFGSPGCVGPELEFGTVVGDRYDEPVLLIKTAWGGRSLYRDFRSPSAGLPKDEVIAAMLAEQRKRRPETTEEEVRARFGASYRAMLDEVRSTLADPKSHVPDYEGQGYELAGFVWFQGWNDMINAEHTAEYAENLAHFIRDVRKDLDAPHLPFVVGEMGIDGDHPGENIRRFKEAQAAAAERPEFRGNVALVRTDVFWDAEAEAVFKKGWREHLDEWNTVGSDWPFHYLGSAKTMSRIGRAFGEAVLELRGERDRGGRAGR